MSIDRDDRSRRGGDAAGRLVEQGVEGVALTFVDTAGITRVKAVPLARLGRAAGWGVGMSPVFDTFVSDDSITTTDALGSPDGDLRLLPDLDRLVVLSGQPGWAWAPVDRYTQDGEPHPACQRLFAQRMVQRAADQGLTATMAVEIEWAVSVGASAEEFTAACTGPAYGMTRLVELSDYARDLLVALREEEVPVEQVHPEYSDGQYEVSVEPLDPVAAADRSVLVRQTVQAVSARHGLRASFSPSVIPGHVGNGGHLHVSVGRDGANLFAGGDGPFGMTGEAASFTAGVLAELPALLAIGAPAVSSYLRLVPSHWAGAYACWGLETREAALRFVTGSTGSEQQSANLEVKSVDLAANPYLLVGSVLAAGVAGIEAGLTLPEPVTGDPGLLDPAERDRRGIARLPETLDEAVEAFESSTVLREALGDVLADAVVAVRRAESARFAGVAPEQVAAALRWVY
jgi:glutamine synthetase